MMTLKILNITSGITPAIQNMPRSTAWTAPITPTVNEKALFTRNLRVLTARPDGPLLSCALSVLFIKNVFLE